MSRRPVFTTPILRAAALASLACAAAACDAGETVEPVQSTKTVEQTPPKGCTKDDECPAMANPCETKACVQGVCGGVAKNDGGTCEDGNLCTQGDVCKAGVCGGGKGKACDDGDVCTQDGCDAVTGGCTYGPAPSQCDDKNPCTTDTCEAKKGCVSTPVKSGFCDDGDACTVSDGCASGKCKGGTARVCNDANPCTTDSCDPAVGCKVELAKTATCTDDNACTLGDACKDGECAAGTQAKVCDDGKSCTADSCDPKSGCVNAAAPFESKLCNDSNPCTTAEACKAGVCSGGLPLVCDDKNACTDDSCDAGTPGQFVGKGCVNKDNAAPCNDGSACTSNDACMGGKCAAGPATVCDDKNPCTVDSCDPKVGCQLANSASACDDANACTEGDLCMDGGCMGGKSKNCDDTNPCTNDSCDKASGCVNQANAATCTDGDACTTGDACAAKKCEGGAAANCNDANVCTDDSCDKASGCVNLANAATCSDGDACTTADVCATKKCVGGTAPNCNDANACTDDSCEKATGCVNLANVATCTDNTVCTVGDKCSGKTCVAGQLLSCDDGKLCTIDTCDPKVGCKLADAASGCDDNNVCTEGDGCQSGACKPGTLKKCDDANACTNDACDPKLGCTKTANTAACEDGNPCTKTDVCKDSSCVAGTQCDDGNPCTSDSCDTGKGCKFENNTLACDDKDVKTEKDVCGSGSCKGTPIKPVPDCAMYCAGVTTVCVGDLAQFSNIAACKSWCDAAKLTAGTVDDKSGNTLGCRIYHASVASTTPDAAKAHCEHTGPSGGNVCGAFCDNFCEATQKACVGGDKVYADATECKTACAKAATTGKSTDTSGETLQCLFYHVGVAATTVDAAKVHCPHAMSPNKAGDPCGPAAVPAGKEYTVTTSGFSFSPDNLTVKVGDTVKFTPSGSHQVTEVGQQDWTDDKFVIKAGGFITGFGETKVWKAEAKGGLYYMCAPHSPSMKGKVIVE